MGASQPQPQQGHQVSHLTSDPHYQQILRQLYANNSVSIANDFPQFQSNFRYNPHRNRADVEIKRTTPIRNDLYLHRKSLCFVPTANPQQFGLTFKFDSTPEVNINVYFFAIEQLNANNITSKIDSCIKGNNITYLYPPGPNQVFEQSGCLLDLVKYQLPKSTDAGSNYYPLIIKMSHRIEPSRAMYVYAAFPIRPSKEAAPVIEIKRVKIEKNNKAFIANEVYGAAHESTQDDFQHSECAICLTEKIDTMIIPCKHMCLCQQCCSDLRQRAQKCPICRRNIERFILIVPNKREEAEEPKQAQEPQKVEEKQKQKEQVIEQPEEFKEQQNTIFPGKPVIIGSSET